MTVQVQQMAASLVVAVSAQYVIGTCVWVHCNELKGFMIRTGAHRLEALHILDAQEAPVVIAPAPVSVEYPNSDTVVIRVPRPEDGASSLQARTH